MEVTNWGARNSEESSEERVSFLVSKLHLKCDDTRRKTRFRLRGETDKSI